jgi:hypothetical protein
MDARHTANGGTTMTNIDAAIMKLRKAQRDQLKATETPAFMAQEIAYRFPGEAWKRRTIRTQKAFDIFLAKLDGDAEVHTRDAD